MSDTDHGSIYIEDETLRGGFTVIPNTILKRRDVSIGAKYAYMLLLMYAWQEGSCFPGQQRMADDMGVSDRTVRTYIRELESVGLVITKRRGLTQTNLYYLPKKSVPERKQASGQVRNERSAQKRKQDPTNKTQKKKAIHTEEKEYTTDEWADIAERIPRSIDFTQPEEH